MLDFATGSGIVAIAAMKAGAACALACDIDPFCAAAVAPTPAANGVEVAFTDADLLAAPPPDGRRHPAPATSATRSRMAERVLAWLGAGPRRAARGC